VRLLSSNLQKIRKLQYSSILDVPLILRINSTSSGGSMIQQSASKAAGAVIVEQALTGESMSWDASRHYMGCSPDQESKSPNSLQLLINRLDRLKM
jgi:hypothetical protein